MPIKDGEVRNPNGLGGFKENPENINRGGRPKNEQRFGYWLQFFKNMSEDDFIEWPSITPREEKYIAAISAYERVKASKTDLPNFREVADRTEGRASQTLIHEGGFLATERLLVEIVEPDEDAQDFTEQKTEADD